MNKAPKPKDKPYKGGSTFERRPPIPAPTKNPGPRNPQQFPSRQASNTRKK